DVRRGLSLLLQTGFLSRAAPRPAAPVFHDVDEAPTEATLAFEHPLLRQAAEQVLRPESRAALHGFLAEAIEEVLGSGARAVASSLARHHRLAGNRPAALKHMVIAARRAVRLDDRPGALRLVREGL